MVLYNLSNTIEIGRPVNVRLDGVMIYDVIEADDFAGYVIVYSRDADGKFILKDDHAATERKTGVVVVESVVSDQ